MKIVVYLQAPTIGGSQTNAIELAAAVRDLGHHVILATGTTGPLDELAADRGLRVVRLQGERRTSRGAVLALRRLVAGQGIDVVHAYEAAATLEAFLGAHLLGRVPLVSSVMAMSVPRNLPASVPLTVGFQTLAEETRRVRRGPVFLLEPPVDTDRNHRSVDGSALAASLGIDDGRPNVVMVSRIDRELKLEGLRRAIQAVAELASRMAVRLVIVGGGEAYGRLSEEAAAINRLLGQSTVLLTGPMADPRPAYALADVALGMGSSALRSMAFGKPTIIIGERGFSEIVTPETIDGFLRHAFYGLGDGNLGPGRLAAQLEDVLRAEPSRREELGRFSRTVVCERFGLTAAAERLLAIYRQTAAVRVARPALAADTLQAAAWTVEFKLGRKTADIGASFFSHTPS